MEAHYSTEETSKSTMADLKLLSVAANLQDGS